MASGGSASAGWTTCFGAATSTSRQADGRSSPPKPPDAIACPCVRSHHGELAAGVPTTNIVRQIVLFGARSRDGWGVGLTILTALANLLPLLSPEEGLSGPLPRRPTRGG